MSKGMEMLINTVIKSTGVDPEKVFDNFAKVQGVVMAAVQNFDHRLALIETEQKIHNELLQKLISLLESEHV